MKGIWGDRGAAAVEFAVLIPLLMVIIFGISEFGFIWLQSHYIANAAREGSRVAARLADPINYSGDREQVESVVKEYLKGLYSDDRVDGNPPYLPPSGGCCDDDGYCIEVGIENEEIPAGLAENPAAVKVTVTVKTAEVWDPILWDLLRLLPGSTIDDVDLSSISAFAVFAVEP